MKGMSSKGVRVNPKLSLENYREEEIKKINYGNPRFIEKNSPLLTSPTNRSYSQMHVKLKGQSSDSSISINQNSVILPKVVQTTNSKYVQINSPTIFSHTANSKRNFTVNNSSLLPVPAFIKSASLNNGPNSRNVDNLTKETLDDAIANRHQKDPFMLTGLEEESSGRRIVKKLAEEEFEQVAPPRAKERIGVKNLNKTMNIKKLKQEIDSNIKQILESKTYKSEEKLKEIWEIYKINFEKCVDLSELEQDESSCLLLKIWRENTELTQGMFNNIRKEYQSEINNKGLEIENMKMRLSTELKYADTKAQVENENLKQQIKLLEQELRSTYESLLKAQREKRARKTSLIK